MNMKRVLEPVDLMVAAGIVATVLGAFLVFVSTHGNFQTVATYDGANLEANDWVQPALGQTLVEISLLERARSDETAKAVKKLNQAAMTAQELSSSTEKQITNLAEHVEKVQVDKTARAEFVKGRSIINFTSRAVKNDSMPHQQREEYNHRMIELAAKAGHKIEEEFQGTEENYFGKAIVAETQRQIEATRRNQEQLGAAIVKVALVQDEYRGALEAAQEQLGLLVSVG